jgi:benzoate-CoA ligase family protein
VTFRPDIPERFNLSDYFLGARIREGRGDHVAVIDDRGRYSYRDVDQMASRVGNALKARGVGPEDRVLIALHDRVEFAATFFGTLRIGAVVTMVNPDLPDGDYAHYVDYTRARAIVCEARLAARIRSLLERAPLVRALVVCDPVDGAVVEDAPGERWSDAVGTASPELATFDSSKDDPAIWLFTSGSTGKPKAAVHLHHDFAFNTECYAKRVLGIRPDDVTLGVPKLFFGYATGSNLMFPFAVGATTVLFADRSTPERIFASIEKYRPTILTSVPTMINKMAQADCAPKTLAPLRLCISAGEALPEELYHRWMARFGVEILDGIGSAELFHIYISNRPGEVRPGTLGRVVPGYEARLVGPEGNDVADGEIGTLWVKGDSAAVYYHQAHEKSKEVLRGDWVVSGDLFTRDADGYFRYAGRADDLLKVGGIFVAPTEVEGCLVQHPEVSEAAVVGFEDDDGLVKAMAYVVPKAGVTPCPELSARIIEHARARLAHYKVPRRVELVASLPRSDRGKILRRELRAAKQ